MAQADFEADRVQGFLAGGAQEAVLAVDWLPKFRSPERFGREQRFQIAADDVKKAARGWTTAGETRLSSTQPWRESFDLSRRLSAVPLTSG